MASCPKKGPPPAKERDSMRWIVFYDGYEPRFETKCSGQIAIGLKEKGQDVLFITKRKRELLKYAPVFNIVQIDIIEELYDLVRPSDRVIFYSWLDPIYTETINILAGKNKNIIIKADSDGRIGIVDEPSHRFSDYIRLHKPPLWKVFPRLLKSRIKTLGKIREQSIIRQIEKVARVAIESPDALQNLCSFLVRNGRNDLVEKICFIPNPVTNEFLTMETPEKQNIIISVGRWEDEIQKNSRALIRSIVKFLELKPQWRVFFIGTGEEILRKYLINIQPEIFARITITGPVEHSEIKKYTAVSKMLFMPSRYESFGIAAAEAVCVGCSLVGSPIESLKYLAMQGFSGTTASTFADYSFLACLLHEAGKWERKEYSPEIIGNFWKSRLSPTFIASEYIRISDNRENRIP